MTRQTLANECFNGLHAGLLEYLSTERGQVDDDGLLSCGWSKDEMVAAVATLTDDELEQLEAVGAID